MPNLNSNTSHVYLLIFMMSVSGRPKREQGYRGMEMTSSGTALQALPGGKLQSYKLQKNKEGKGVGGDGSVGKVLAKKTGGPECGSPAPIESQAWWHMLVTIMLGGG